MPNRLPTTLLLLTTALLGACANHGSASDPSYTRLMHLADDLDRRGDPASAAALYQNAAQQPGEHPDAWRKVGETSLAAGDARSAEAAYQQALALRPQDSAALLGLGTAQLRQGKLERAVSALSEAAALGQQPQAWSRLGVAHILRGDTQAAQTAFQRSLSLDANNLDTRCNLALAYALGGQQQQAVASLAEVERSPRVLPRHQRNQVLVMVLAGQEAQLKRLSLDSLTPAERQALILEARRIKSLPDAQAKAQALGLVKSG